MQLGENPAHWPGGHYRIPDNSSPARLRTTWFCVHTVFHSPELSGGFFFFLAHRLDGTAYNTPLVYNTGAYLILRCSYPSILLPETLFLILILVALSDAATRPFSLPKLYSPSPTSQTPVRRRLGSVCALHRLFSNPHLPEYLPLAETRSPAATLPFLDRGSRGRTTRTICSQVPMLVAPHFLSSMAPPAPRCSTREASAGFVAFRSVMPESGISSASAVLTLPSLSFSSPLLSIGLHVCPLTSWTAHLLPAVQLAICIRNADIPYQPSRPLPPNHRQQQ
ncbi:hypothetical protein K505DRAFT_5966 [Melanomma pulvis-pyrius CBS 109.77]|uniref:Uncharacterized protein n=1 Tax=Melanomma pulvis-pyrius CBS 109.77 TaxID=1314802 RepID=A0A6A6XHF4_9PLEO|nr:hypothetical protein K505DRAFT_5966 [Melanomma pulvis-pyrius CBS 109.77]